MEIFKRKCICFIPRLWGSGGHRQGLQIQESNLWFEAISTSMAWQIRYCCCTLWINTKLFWSPYICKIFFCQYYYSYSLCWWYYCHWRWSRYYSIESLYEFSFSYIIPWSLEVSSRDWGCLFYEKSFLSQKNILLVVGRNWYIRI